MVRTKAGFLRKLSVKLDVLQEEEKKDILDEYANHIDLKVKKGKTEEEAVADFGDIDELADEILDAYKIKSKRRDDESKFDEYFKEFVEAAKEVGRNVLKSMSDDTLGFVFKVLVVLIVIGLLRIPFYMIESIGKGIFEGMMFGVFEDIFVFIWKVIVNVGYLIASALFVYSTFKDKTKMNNLAEKIKDDVVKDEKPKKKEEKKEDKNEKVVSSVSKGIWSVLKIFAIFLCFPFFMAEVSFVVALGVFIKLAIEGIVIWGALGVLLGLVMIVGAIISLIINSAFHPERVKTHIFINIIIGFLFIGFGAGAFIFDVMRYEYINEVPENEYSTKVETYTYNVNEKTYLYYDYGTLEYVYDDTLEDEVIIEVSYIGDFITVTDTRDDDYIAIDIDAKDDYYFGEFKGLYNIFIEDIKDKKIHNYFKLLTPEYKIYIDPDNNNLIDNRRD